VRMSSENLQSYEIYHLNDAGGEKIAAN
jgi:hypothetical protein